VEPDEKIYWETQKRLLEGIFKTLNVLRYELQNERVQKERAEKEHTPTLFMGWYYTP